MENKEELYYPEQLELFKKYNVEPVKGTINCSPARTELLILSKLGKSGKEIAQIMGNEKLAAGLANH